MSSRRDREKREERQNEQAGGWAGAPTTWVDNTPAPSPMGGGTKTSAPNGATAGKNDTYTGVIGQVRDNPGQTNYKEPVGAGWDKGASASSLSSMGDEKVGGPNHVVVGRDTNTGTGTNTGTNTGTGTGTNTGTGQPRDRRAENRAELARVTNKKTGSHTVVWGAGRTTPTNPADQAPQGRRITSPNTGTLPTLSQNTVTSVQPKAATATKQDKQVCKARPKDNRPKGGGGGGPKKFVPWC